MKITQSLLAILFVVQIVVAGILFYQQRSTASIRPDEKLLELDMSAIDQLVIEDAGSSISLRKEAAGWQLSDFGLPAAPNKAETIIENLLAAKTGWAVANRRDSHDQLQVAEDNFNVKVAVYQGDEVKELYVGTSPGLRRSHVRLAERSDVYSVALNAFELPASSEQWLDQTLLSVQDLTAVQMHGHKLESIDGSWTIATIDGELLQSDSSAIEGVINRIEELRVIDVAADVSVEDEGVEVIVTRGEDEFTYGFHKVGDQYLLKRSDISAMFGIGESDYEAIASLDVSTLINTAGTEEAQLPSGNSTGETPVTTE